VDFCPAFELERGFNPKGGFSIPGVSPLGNKRYDGIPRISRLRSKLDFISDEPMGDAVVKAVMGILASSLEQGLAHALAESLPEPLTYERLRGHRQDPCP
jgi:hypothetical protein